MQATTPVDSNTPNSRFFPPAAQCLAGLMLLGLLATGSAQAVDLNLSIRNLGSDKGTVYVALYDSADSFKSRGKGLAGQYIPVYGSTVTATFRGLQPGRYALSVFHDEHGNGKLDTNLLGLPTEPYGFSRDAVGTMGPPTFDAAAIDLKEDSSIVINLH